MVRECSPDVPCFDTTIRFNPILSGLIRYRFGTAKYFARVLIELKRTTTKHDVADQWPFDVLIKGGMVSSITRVMLENVSAFKNRTRSFPSEYHKQFCLSFIDTDIAYFENWIGWCRTSANPKFNNPEFIHALQSLVGIIEKMRLEVISMPIHEPRTIPRGGVIRAR